jgi:SAM-dependent methyltransferase
MSSPSQSSKLRQKPAARKSLYWAAYLPPALDLNPYRSAAAVLDIGCGNGNQLTHLRTAGFHPIELEIAEDAARVCRARGHVVVRATAKHHPFRSNSAAEILCKVVIPYTDERVAIGEIARLLARDGAAMLYHHGLGYSLRYLLLPDVWRRSVYAARTIVNTVVYRILGRRLPGWLGDTLFQSEARLCRYYKRFGLRLEATIPCRHFLGQAVFIVHVVRK